MMRGVRILLFAAAVLLDSLPVLLPAQEREDRPTVDVSEPNFAYTSEPCTFTPEHFRNMRTYIFGKKSVIDSGTLRNGRYDRKWTTQSGSSSVSLVWLRVPASKPERAVALFSWGWVGGSSSQSDVVQVFGCKDDHLVVVQQISNDAHGLPKGVNYDAGSGILTVKSVRYGSGAHCCPEKLDIVTFKWSDNRFQRLSWKTVPMPNDL